MSAEKKQLKIGLVGFGSMGKTHSYAIDNMKYFYSPLPFEAKIAGVCTTSIEKSEKVAKAYGFGAAAENAEALIADKSIDIIDICTPNIFHYDILKKALLAKKHVYCEKPLCVTADEADEIAALAKESGCICNIVFNYRHMAPLTRAKQLIEEGKLGRILSFSATYLHNSCTDTKKNAGWKQNRDICGGGVLFDLGSHIIDLVYYLCGEFDSVSAASQIAFPTRAGMNGEVWQTNADEATYIIATLKSGAVGTLTASKIAVGSNDDLRIEVFGEHGALRFDLMDPNWLYFYDGNAQKEPIGGLSGYTRIECVGRYPAPGGIFPSPKAPTDWLRGHVTSMYNFLNAVYEGNQASPSFSDAAHVQAVMEAAYRSANTHSAEKV